MRFFCFLGDDSSVTCHAQYAIAKVMAGRLTINVHEADAKQPVAPDSDWYMMRTYCSSTSFEVSSWS